MEKLTSIEEVRAEMHMEFAMVSARFTDMDARFNEVDARFNQVDARFNQVAEGFVSLEKQMTAMHKNLVKWAASFSLSLLVTTFGLIVTVLLTR